MTELAIRIRIADREYPMRVTAEEEARLRVAGRLLNDRIKVFRDEYGLTDQDLLAMIALEAVADRLLAEQRLGSAGSDFHRRLDHLHELLLAAPLGPGGPDGAASSAVNVSAGPSS